MRDLPTVLEKMIDEIPIVAENSDLIRKLMSIRESAMYAAPEMMRTFWGMGALTLQQYFPEEENLENEWQQKVSKIWLNRK